MIIKVSAITGEQLRQLELIAVSDDFKAVVRKPSTWNSCAGTDGSYRKEFPRESLLKFMKCWKTGNEPMDAPIFDVSLEIAEVCWIPSNDKVDPQNWDNDYAYGYRRYGVHIRFVLQVLAVLDRFMCTRTIRDYAGSVMS